MRKYHKSKIVCLVNQHFLYKQHTLVIISFINICVGIEKSGFSVTCLSVFGYLLLGDFVTALVPSVTACFANFPGSKRPIVVWISLDCGLERNSTLPEKHRPFDTQTPVSATTERNRTTLHNQPPFPKFCSDGASESERSLSRRTLQRHLSLCYPRKTNDNHARGYSACKAHQGRESFIRSLIQT